MICINKEGNLNRFTKGLWVINIYFFDSIWIEWLPINLLEPCIIYVDVRWIKCESSIIMWYTCYMSFSWTDKEVWEWIDFNHVTNHYVFMTMREILLHVYLLVVSVLKGYFCHTHVNRYDCNNNKLWTKQIQINSSCLTVYEYAVKHDCISVFGI